MEQFTNYTDLILAGQSSSLSYQLAYDTVYKLTKDHRQKDLLDVLEQKISAYLTEQYTKLPAESMAPALLRILQEAGVVSGKLAEVCLFLDVNYCQKEQGVKLKKRLADTTFRSLIAE